MWFFEHSLTVLPWPHRGPRVIKPEKLHLQTPLAFRVLKLKIALNQE